MMTNKANTTRLVDIDLDEISLVDRPANRGSRVVLTKRDSDEGEAAMDTVEKCARAAQGGLAKDWPAADFERAMDKLAERTQKKRGGDYYAAYQEALDSPTGKLLYQGLIETKPAPTAKATPEPEPNVTKAEARLDELAKRKAEDEGIDFYTAYSDVLNSEEGKRLYAEEVGLPKEE